MEAASVLGIGGIPIDLISGSHVAGLAAEWRATPLLLFNQAQNIPGLTKIQGFELLYQQRLDFMLDGLGVNINYTNLDSGERVVTGLAEDNYNAILYYENSRFATRLTYNFRGDYIECTVNCGSTSPEAQSRREAGYLDFNTSVNFETWGQKFTVSLEALNVLWDEEEYSFLGYDNRANILNAPGRTILLGIRGQF